MNLSRPQFLDNLVYLNPWRKSRLETYILQTCISAFVSALMIVAALIFLIEYVGISKTLGAKADVSGLSVIGLMLEKSPGSILVLLPFAFLFGALFAFVNLNRRSELIAMRAAGVSAWRFVMPAAIMAFAFGLLTIGLLNPIASLLNDHYERVTARLDQADAPPQGPANGAIYLRQGDGKQQIVIRAASQDNIIGHLKGVTFWIYDIDAKETPVFRKRIDAQEATLRPGYWQLRNAQEATVTGPPTAPYDVLTMPSNLDPQKAFKKYASTQSVPFWRLPGLIHQNRISGFSTALYELKLHQLLSTPLMFAAMTALGAVFSLRLMRLGGVTGLVISGISLGFVIFFVNQLFSSMGKAGVIPIFMAGWSPAILAMLVATTLIVYTEDG
ncbi:LPS export ABC transporter permease LptG [Asticcacaulis sp.]|uniref:LPS export ABC transporter permease LptG n=1 Tax=Asticcacaulis sp. TaxID=1872648 RepID=UPI002C38373F|nr:LPS export ABC transporter permease LptG [Asticcacaulis sp.]HTM79540.1 LPS export ABC transporter permease LptG [Asticcacaulis sp.]